MELEVIVGDITRQKVDAIVNAANQTLLGGAGVDGAIHRAAGPRLLEACAKLGGCHTGDAKATPGFDLPCRWVIHTVGPVWYGGGGGEDLALAACYRRSIELADRLGATTVAFPAISTGAYGFPPDQAAAIAVSTLRSLTAKVRRVRLIAFDHRTFRLLERQGVEPGSSEDFDSLTAP